MFIKVPTYQFHCNLVICPLPKGEKKKVMYIGNRKNSENFFTFAIQGESYIYMLSNDGTSKLPTGQLQNVEFSPNCMYCYLPSYGKDCGYIQKFDYVPMFLKSLRFLVEIKERVSFIWVIKNKWTISDRTAKQLAQNRIRPWDCKKIWSLWFYREEK